MSKLMKCKTCGAEIASTAKACPSCGAKNKPPVYKRVWFWILIIFVAISVIAGSSNSNTSTENSAAASSDTVATEQSNQVVSAKDEAFTGNCGISASAEMSTSIIGFPELTISITNTTDKTISAIQFYAVPYDVYGDEITGWTSQNHLYTDTSIAPGASDSATYQLIEDSVKTVKLYVYSVYFSDGTEWGNKDATKSTILDNGAIIEVSGES